MIVQVPKKNHVFADSTKARTVYKKLQGQKYGVESLLLPCHVANKVACPPYFVKTL